jgi:hypothetical protein
MSKKAEWLVFDYDADDFKPYQLAEHITKTCQMGYEVFKIREITTHMRINKLFNSFDDVIHEKISLDNGDVIANKLWARLYYKK